jgi:TM2 domain-containing membrane protein YozV
MATNSFIMIPDLEMDELSFLKSLTQNLSEDQLQQFILIYNTRRRSAQTILLCTLLGFVVVAGVQRFITNNIGMGILYLLTGGLCLIGTIVDLINYKQLAFEYNRKQAMEVLELQKMA